MVIQIATLILHYGMLWLPRSNQSGWYTLYIQHALSLFIQSNLYLVPHSAACTTEPHLITQRMVNV